jgi:transcriptional regulator GlxA family with amidase domain
MTARRVGILLYQDVEVLDFCGPLEVFSVTRLAPDRTAEPAFEVLLLAEDEGPVRTASGMRVLPDSTLAASPQVEVLVVPGGPGTRAAISNPRLIEAIRRLAGPAELVTSVCTGAFLLAQAGLLDGKRATTHGQSVGRLREAFPRIQVMEDHRVVDEGRVITSAGISAGIDMALRVVARLHGIVVARSTARHMEYPFPEGVFG